MTDWADLVAQAKPRTKTVRLCLRGDLLGDLEGARQALKDVETGAPSDSLAGTPSNVVAARKAVDDAEQAVFDACVVFSLKGLPRGQFKQLEADHPDPKGDGWDEAAFPEALVRACLVDPVVAPDQPLFDALTVGEAEKLFWAAFGACSEADDIPLPRRG